MYMYRHTFFDLFLNDLMYSDVVWHSTGGKKTNLALQELVNDHHATVCSLWSFVVVCGRLWSAFSPLVITCNYIMAEHGQSWPMSMFQRMQSWCQM